MISVNQPLQIPLPPFADEETLGEWEDIGGKIRRMIESTPMPLQVTDLVESHEIRVVATQNLDGSIESEDGYEPYIRMGSEEFPLNEAGALAYYLDLAVTYAERWTNSELDLRLTMIPGDGYVWLQIGGSDPFKFNPAEAREFAEAVMVTASRAEGNAR